MRLAAAELVESREILPGQWLQAFHAPDIASGSRAGQFVHVRTGDFSGMVLRRPFSLNTTDASTGIITIHFRVIGRGTEWFTQLRPGDTVDMLGPLGRPFEVDSRSRHLLLVAGGLGIAGVRMLADEAIRDGRQVTLLFGGASLREVYPSSLLPDEVEYVVATDDGSMGHHGYVTDLLPEYEAWADQAFACGPAPDARRPVPAGREPPRADGRRQPRAQARRREGRPDRLAGGASQDVPPGLDGAEHGLRGRGVSRLRRHERHRDAATRLPRGPGLRVRRAPLGRAVVMTRTPLDRVAIWTGLLGSSIIALGSVVTALAYTGSDGQPYSPLNHFVSELGEIGVSELAMVFNIALRIGGACFVVFMFGLAVTRPGALRYLYGLTGVIAGIGGAFVGRVPDERPRQALDRGADVLPARARHRAAGLDRLRAPTRTRVSRAGCRPSARSTVAAFAIFLAILFGGDNDLAHPDERVAVWPLTIFEWLLIVGILLWVFLTAWTWRRATTDR